MGKKRSRSISKRGARRSATTVYQNPWKAGKWIKASAVRVRRVAGRVVMDIKKSI